MKYAIVLSITFILAYVNNVVLDTNVFRANYHIISNIFVKWHKGKGKYDDEGTVFQNITAGALALIRTPISLIDLAGSLGALLFLSVVYGEDTRVVTMANLAAAIAILQSIANKVASLLTKVQTVTSGVVPVERVAEVLVDQSSDKNYRPGRNAVQINGETPIVLGDQEHVAIIGYNGSGKSTLLNMIAGIPYQDCGVKVTVFGNDAEKLSYESRRACISIAPKDEMLFEVTALENVLMSAEVDEESRVHGLGQN